MKGKTPKLALPELIKAIQELEIKVSNEKVANKRQPLNRKLAKLRNML